MLFYLEFPQYENEEFWAYLDRLVQYLDSLDYHGFSEEELCLTIEKGINCQVKCLFDSLCDGDLSSKSDEEAYNLFDWLNRESRKPNFSLLLSIEENAIVDVGESFEPLSDDNVKAKSEFEASPTIASDELIGFSLTKTYENSTFEELSGVMTMMENSLFDYMVDETSSERECVLGDDCFEENDFFNDTWGKESVHIFDDSLEVKWDDEPLSEEVLLEKWDFEGDLIEEPIFERFDAPALVYDEHLKPIDPLDLISLDPLLEEYDSPLLDIACMGESFETPLPYKFDACDSFSPLFERFVFDMDGCHEKVRGNETSGVSFVVHCPVIAGFDNVRRLKDVSLVDDEKDMGGLAHKLWNPG